MYKVNLITCLTLAALTISLIIPCVTASSSTMWSKTYGGLANDRAFSLIQTADGGYAVVGTSLSYSTTGYVNSLLLVTDANGELLWNLTYSGLGATYPCAFIQTSDGGYALAGYSYDLGNVGSLYPWLAKTDNAGNLQWNRTYMDLGSLIFNLVQTSDGGYALVGYITHSEEVVSAWLAKTDAYGNVTWSQEYGTSGDNELYAVLQNSDEGYTLAGYTTSAGAGKEDFWLIRTDSTGNIQWSQTYGTPEYDMFNSLIRTADGGYALVGYSNASGVSEDYLLIKTNSLGEMQWNQTYGDSNIDEAFSGIQTTDGGYALTGVTVTSDGYGNAWLVKTNSEGNMVWNQTYAGSADSVLYSIIQVNDNGYVLAGFTNSSSTSQDVWLLKTDEKGVIPEFSGSFVLLLLAICTIFVAIILRRTVTNKTP